MKKGFEIFIQKDLSIEEKEKAVNFCKCFVDKTCADPKMRYFGVKGGGYTSGLWRGRLGLSVNWDKNLVFRRISKNKRSFAVVRLETLEVFNDKVLHKTHGRNLIQNGGDLIKHCMCPQCRGSIKVRFKTKPDMELYIRIGDVKG